MLKIQINKRDPPLTRLFYGICAIRTDILIDNVLEKSKNLVVKRKVSGLRKSFLCIACQVVYTVFFPTIELDYFVEDGCLLGCSSV
jgi:hypothetical protein